jgi:hypothetical protein
MNCLADLVLVAHLAFVLFAISGGLLVLRWRRLAWLHLPALAWGAGIELIGGICPLTWLEDALRESAGGTVASADFVDRCISTVLYPASLTRAHQVALGLALLLLNAVVYGFVLRRTRGGRLRVTSAQ